jgi:ABC-2 type transport system ATP-binding protein
MLHVNHIHFSYGRVPILRDITFDVEPGEILAVVGANGAGKTTLLKMLATLLIPAAGEIHLDAVSPFQAPLRYRHLIGYISEHGPLYPEMTVEAYLIHRAQLKGERHLRIRRRVADLISQCDLQSVRQQRIRTLSYGYAKRIGIADALITHPSLLLLDDPLANLDEVTRRLVAATLTAASSRSSIILTGHGIREMMEWCTRIAVLHKGTLVGIHRTSEYTTADLHKLITTEMSTGLEFQP